MASHLAPRTSYLFSALVGALMPVLASSAEISVMSVGAVKSAFTDAVASWEKSTGNKVVATFNPAGDVRKKLAAGEGGDVLVLPAEAMATQVHEGKVGPARMLGVVTMAAAVKKGAPVPDISTAEALKKTLLSAKSVTYMDPEKGTSGKYFDEKVLPKLGVRDEVRAKAVLGDGGYIADKVARGEAEIAFHQLTEILPVPGVTVVGPLPAEFGANTTYSAAVFKGAKQPKEAQALVDYLASPEGRKFFLDRGFTAP
jgi:molybdate transport system substrate-binding protein